ncbi:hypothetical protein K435DRAFT_790668 [Dendrothele bispora CBS 962.96]|uniref:Uncharacterized protein n=1 Tax=Dendrothele bispora (strain CBS 962.96) TaxID=1314807 RepID=A0A4S8MPW9_DENBC|nr:hypothetical protein K435DRAFT_790668 [Dendrothele bispora CBS 962.96]
MSANQPQPAQPTMQWGNHPDTAQIPSPTAAASPDTNAIANGNNQYQQIPWDTMNTTHSQPNHYMFPSAQGMNVNTPEGNKVHMFNNTHMFGPNAGSPQTMLAHVSQVNPSANLSATAGSIGTGWQPGNAIPAGHSPHAMTNSTANNTTPTSPTQHNGSNFQSDMPMNNGWPMAWVWHFIHRNMMNASPDNYVLNQQNMMNATPSNYMPNQQRQDTSFNMAASGPATGDGVNQLMITASNGGAFSIPGPFINVLTNSTAGNLQQQMQAAPMPVETPTNAPAPARPKGKGKVKNSTLEISYVHDAFNEHCGYSKNGVLPHPPGHSDHEVRMAEDGKTKYLDMNWSKGPRSPENKRVYEEIIRRLREQDRAETDESAKKFYKVDHETLLEAFATYFTTRRIIYKAQNNETAAETQAKKLRRNRRNSRKTHKVIARRQALPKFHKKHGEKETHGAVHLVLSECQSSEYSDTDTPGENLKILDLKWRNDKVSQFYYELDDLSRADEDGQREAQSGKVVKGVQRKVRHRDGKNRQSRKDTPKHPPRVCVKPQYINQYNVKPNDPSWTIITFLDKSYSHDEGYEAGDEGTGGKANDGGNTVQEPGADLAVMGSHNESGIGSSVDANAAGPSGDGNGVVVGGGATVVGPDTDNNQGAV